MSSFGSFESVRELHRTGFTVVYSGRGAAGNEDKFAIKMFQPSSFMLGEEQAQTESRRFLNSARIQKKVADSGAQHWAPVYEFGSNPEGTFYTTNKYDRSLQQLIDGRIKVSTQVLHTIIESIVKGLIELKKECGRPHGNLKATNVLIVGTGDISQTKIVLSDPLSDEQVDGNVHWDHDLRAIGELIHELITHRSTPGVGGWQVPDSEEWSTLVKQAKSWKNLCNLLLNAGVRPGTVTVETVFKELEEIQKAKQGLSYRWLIAAGLGIIVCVAVLVILFRRPPPPEKTEWESLCNQYITWIDGLRKESANKQVDWSQDAKLAAMIEKTTLASYPYKVMVNEGMGSINEIMGHPEYAEQRKTQNALAAIEEISSILDPNSPNAWVPLVKMADTAKKFTNRGWQEPAIYLKNLVEGVKPEPNKPVLENVRTILELSQKGILENIDLSLQKIADYQKTVKSSRDPILVKLDDVYVNNEAAGASDVNELNDELAKIVELNRRITEFIESDWQTQIDQETFLTEHGGDTPPETLTDATFTKRLEVFEMYRFIHPDPRENLFALVNRIKEAIPLALISNPVEANPCKQEFDKLQPDIETVRKIKGIEKNRSDIADALNSYMPKLQQINDRITAATETASEYKKRIQQIATIATLEEINGKWVVLRDDLFDKYPENEIQRDLPRYAKLRQKMDATEKSLLKLDEELQKELPSQIEVPQDETAWHSKVVQAYSRERKNTIRRILEALPVVNEVPDVNEQNFTQSKQTEFTAFEQSRRDLTGIVTALDAIEKCLDACYLLDDQLPQKIQESGSIRALWDKWKKNDIFTKPPFDNAFKEPIERIVRIEKIDTAEDRQQLIDTALDSGSPREIIYAAWIRLGALSNPAWPEKYEDLCKDREVRQKLRTEFEAISRRNELLGNVTKTAIKRESVLIDKNGSDDKILAGFDKFTAEAISSYDLKELENLEGLSITLADYVCGTDWQNDKIRKDIFFESSNVHKTEGPVTAQTFRDWLTEVNDYKKLTQDPREKYSWNEKIAEITQIIENELGSKQGGSSTETSNKLKKDFLSARLNDISRLINTVGGALTGSSKQNIEKLKQEYTKFVSTTQIVDAMLDLPAIEKNKDKIDTDTCKNLWETLLSHEMAIRSIIKPEYCKHLEFLEGGTQRLVFATRIELSANFEPININRLPSVTDKKTIVDIGSDILKQVTDTAKSILSPSKLRELLDKTVQVADWEQIRKAVKDGQREWIDFFQTIDLNDARNVGWPKYIVSKKDPSIILRFIPASSSNPEPFYMAIHEISNSQYRTFLEEYGAKRGGPKLPGWSVFTDKENNNLIQCTVANKPPTSIKWDESTNTFRVAESDSGIPATWVTFTGAQIYSKWLGGELPTASQHQYACRAGTGSIYPWGSNSSAMIDYAHVRSSSWQNAASDWNRNKNSKVPPLPVAPIGAVEDYQDQKTLDVNAIASKNDIYNSAWPVTGAIKANAWDLYDMIGNVWEWCLKDADNPQPVICGGSCLAPPRYVLMESESDYQIDFDDRASDVGFRVIVPAR
jgi:formylglycine-generating enzyme required for sulfatase activity